MQNAVLEAILTRRSIRKYTQNPIPKEILEKIVEAGRYAPRKKYPTAALYGSQRKTVHKSFRHGAGEQRG